jgi:hypothetical protein
LRRELKWDIYCQKSPNGFGECAVSPFDIFDAGLTPCRTSHHDGSRRSLNQIPDSVRNVTRSSSAHAGDIFSFLLSEL